MHNRIYILLLLSVFMMGATGQSLSFKEAMRTAFRENLDIKIAKLDAELGKAFMESAEAAFDPLATAQIDWMDDRDKPASTVSGTRTFTKHFNFGLSKSFATGTNVDLQFINTYMRSNSAFATIRRYWDPRLALTVTQPLLNNFFGYQSRRSLKEAALKNAVLNLQSKDNVELVLANVSGIYWNLSAAYDHLSINKQALKQAQKLYNANKRKLKLGTIEKTDLLASRANVRSRENDILSAQNTLEVARTHLKQALQDESSTLVTAKDPLTFNETPFTFSSTVTRALNNRKDYLKAQDDLKQKNVTLQMSKNALLPKLDLIGTIATNGLDPNYSPAAAELRTDEFPTYFIGVQISYPFGNHAAVSARTKSRIDKLAAVHKLSKLQNDIFLEISNKIKTLNTLANQVKATKNIKELIKQKMVGEERKFNRGRSSINFVIQFQEDYLQSSRQHLRTLLDYELAVINLRKSEGTLLDTYLKDIL